MALVNAEDHLIGHAERTRTGSAISTLAFLRDGCEDFGRIQFFKFINNDSIRNRLFPCFQHFAIDRSHHGPTLVAFERDLLAVLYRHDGPIAFDASLLMWDRGEVKRFVRHFFMLSPDEKARLYRQRTGKSVV